MSDVVHELDPLRDMARTLLNQSIDRPRNSHPPQGGSKLNLPVIAMDGCWCGQPFDHVWPGRDGGEPHPRENGETWQDAARRLPGGRS